MSTLSSLVYRLFAFNSLSILPHTPVFAKLNIYLQSDGEYTNSAAKIMQGDISGIYVPIAGEEEIVIKRSH
jgi:hypothetical protein